MNHQWQKHISQVMVNGLYLYSPFLIFRLLKMLLKHKSAFTHSHRQSHTNGRVQSAIRNSHTNIHMPMPQPSRAIWGWARLKEPEIEPPTIQLSDNPLLLLSYSHKLFPHFIHSSRSDRSVKKWRNEVWNKVAYYWTDDIKHWIEWLLCYFKLTHKGG